MKLPRGVWSPIARRPIGGALGSWVEYDAAPISIDQAWDGVMDRKVIMMHRKVDGMWQLVVTPARS